MNMRVHATGRRACLRTKLEVHHGVMTEKQSDRIVEDEDTPSHNGSSSATTRTAALGADGSTISASMKAFHE